MRLVPRPNRPPPALADPAFARMRRAYLDYLRLDPRARAQTRQPDRHLPDVPGLTSALADAFDRKCAFCERRVLLGPWRFRPTSDANPQDKTDDQAHLRYGWLADVWQNLYPICQGCRPAQASVFPVSGKRAPVPSADSYEKFLLENKGLWHEGTREKALLLDPCKDDPKSHLRATLSGELIPLSERGEITIAHYNLNRATLVKLRQAALAPGRTIAAQDEFSGFALLLQDLPQDLPPVRSAVSRRARLQPADAPIPAWRLDRVEIRHFKSIEHLVLTLPPPPSIARAQAGLILGENAAGKSSILEAIALCLIDDEARARLALRPETLLLDPRFLGDDSLPMRREGFVHLHLSTPDGAQADCRLILRPGALAAFASSDAPLPPVFGYGAYRHYRSDNRRWMPERGVLSLFRSDNLLSNPERWLLALPNDRFDAVIRALRSVFGIGFSHIEADHATRQCIVHTITDGTATRTPLSSVSSGFRTILALVCDAIRWVHDTPENPQRGRLEESRAMILIDEVEAHLHPRWKLRIMDGLREALPGAIFLATTHDPLCLRGMHAGEVQVLRRRAVLRGESELPSLVETLEDLPDVAELTVDQLLTADFFGLFDTDDPHLTRAVGRVADRHLAQSPDTGRAMSDLVASLQAVRSADGGGDPALLARFRHDIRSHLPTGRTEVARLVEEAVADYLIARAQSLPAQTAALRSDTRSRIAALLRGG